jgi:HEAT repeat protein
VRITLLGKTRSRHATTYLINFLHDEYSSLHELVFDALTEIDCIEARNRIREAVSSKSLEKCRAAIWSLAKKGHQFGIDVISECLVRKEEEVRISVAEALGEIVDESALGILSKALLDLNVDVRCSAVDSLGNICSDQAVDLLAKALDDISSEVRFWVTEALGDIGIESAILVLSQALNHADPEVRANAAFALGETHNEFAIPFLQEALSHKDLDVRIHAIEALGEINTESAVEVLYTRLKFSKENEKEKIVEALAQIDKLSSKKVLVELLDADNPLLVSCAAFRLGQLNYKPSIPFLKDLLLSEDSDIKSNALTALRRIDINTAQDAVFEIIENELNFSIDLVNASALGLIDNKEAINKFVKGFNNEHSEIRAATAYIIGEIGDRSSTRFLLLALEDENSYVRASAIDALVSLDYEDILSVLSEALNDVDSHVQWCAIQELMRNRTSKAIDILAQALNNEELEFDSFEALKEIDGRSVIDSVFCVLENSAQKTLWGAHELMAEIGMLEDLNRLSNLILERDDVYAFKALSVIQARYGVYNYNIYLKTQELNSYSEKTEDRFKRNSFRKKEYQKILSILHHMVSVMERNPSTFTDVGEEALRDQFLVQLNGKYEGQATGETVNHKGKTDILVRLRGENVFIGECKFWGGEAKLKETLDQLLGYTTWHDEQLGMLIFNRNKNFSAVLKQIPDIIKSHSSFLQEVTHSETQFHFVVKHPDDPDRRLKLAVLVFDIPSPST